MSLGSAFPSSLLGPNRFLVAQLFVEGDDLRIVIRIEGDQTGGRQGSGVQHFAMHQLHDLGADTLTLQVSGHRKAPQ